MLKEFKDNFAWTYKYLKGIPLELAQHKIELDIIILSTHQTKYKLNPNDVTMVKQDINKLLTIGFIEFVKEATWLSPIVVVPKKNGKLKFCIDFRKLNEASIPITFHI
jgi:MarR-like DNA-binding transcriptional regulator SgrR of sgrS sRNA